MLWFEIKKKKSTNIMQHILGKFYGFAIYFFYYLILANLIVNTAALTWRSRILCAYIIFFMLCYSILKVLIVEQIIKNISLFEFSSVI